MTRPRRSRASRGRRLHRAERRQGQEVAIEAPNENPAPAHGSRETEKGTESVSAVAELSSTWIGLVTPLGVGTEATWQALLAGRSGIGPITQFDASQFAARIAAEVKGFDPLNCMEKKELQEDGPLHPVSPWPRRSMAIDGLRASRRRGQCREGGRGHRARASAASPLIEQKHTIAARAGPATGSSPSSSRADRRPGRRPGLHPLGRQGSEHAACTACATGAHAIGDALPAHPARRRRRDDRRRQPRRAITPLPLAGFAPCARSPPGTTSPSGPPALRRRTATASSWARAPASWSWRSSSTPGRAGRTIYAEVVGYGMTGDAYHITAPAPRTATAPSACMQLALSDAGVAARRTSTTSTPTAPRPAERRDRDHGHQGGLRRARRASVADQLDQVDDRPPARRGRRRSRRIIGARPCATAIIPPTINYDDPDPECDLDYVPNRRARPTSTRPVQLLRLRRDQRRTGPETLRRSEGNSGHPERRPRAPRAVSKR